jgi:hypothetical protein
MQRPAAIKIARTLFSLESCMLEVLDAGFTRQSDPRCRLASGSGYAHSSVTRQDAGSSAARTAVPTGRANARTAVGAQIANQARPHRDTWATTSTRHSDRVAVCPGRGTPLQPARRPLRADLGDLAGPVRMLPHAAMQMEQIPDACVHAPTSAAFARGMSAFSALPVRRRATLTAGARRSSVADAAAITEPRCRQLRKGGGPAATVRIGRGHFVGAGLDVTCDQAGNLMGWPTVNPAIFPAEPAAANMSRTSAVFWLNVVRISRVIQVTPTSAPTSPTWVKYARVS